MPGDDITIVDDAIAGPHGPVPIRRYRPSAAGSGRGVEQTQEPAPHTRPTIVWVHGGGFFAGGLDLPESDAVGRALAAEGFAVVAVDYRLVPPLGSRRPVRRGVPVVRYPVPLDDVVAVVAQIRSESPVGLVLGGASAGACLAAATVSRLADDGQQPLLGVFLAYGFFHAVFPAPPADLVRPASHRRITHAPRFLNLMTRNYAGSAAAMADPLAFPGGHPLPDFPRTLMLDADRDSIRASSARFAHELDEAGTDLEYRMLPGTQHAFLNRPADPVFGEAVGAIVDWLGGTAS